MSNRRVGTSTGTPAADINAVTREKAVFALRVQGWEFPAIAEECGYANASGAYKAWKRALARIPTQAIEEMRQQIYAQQMHAIKCLSGKIARGDSFAVKEMTAIHERMARLFGLDTVQTSATLTPLIVEVPQSLSAALRLPPQPVQPLMEVASGSAS